MRISGLRIAVLTGSVTILSAVMKNIGALAIVLPIAAQVVRRNGRGGLVTLIGTSPNIPVSRLRAKLPGKPFADDLPSLRSDPRMLRTAVTET